MAKLLFICSKNQWRSPTAQLLFKNHALHQARSGGTSEKARIKVSEKLLSWADEVFVMERKHKALITQRFSGACEGREITVLDIVDNYRYGDEELIILLRQSLKSYL